jgi:hypothetical protein
MTRRLIKLAKDPNSGNGGCMTVYLTEDTAQLVVQGDQVDGDTFAELENVLPGETAVTIDLQIVKRAIEEYEARQVGR